MTVEMTPWCERTRHETCEQVATAVAPATCGELVQGVVDDNDFLITSPIDLFARVTVRLTKAEGVDVPCARGYAKLARAVRATLDHLACDHRGAHVTVSSNVPRGKGLASSSCEITAAISATAEATGSVLPAYHMSRIAVAIEPSDAVYFKGVVMYDHVRGELLEVFGDPPSLAFVCVDTGGAVDTCGFDRERARANARAHEHELAHAVALVRQGFWKADPSLVAQGALVSARVNQNVLFKPSLEDLVAAGREVGALGANCAHSGTVIGVLFDPLLTDADRVRRRVEDVVGADAVLGVYSLMSGGSRLVESSRGNLSASQRDLIDTLGEPRKRFGLGNDFVLEFDDLLGKRGERLFAYPDGSLSREHPQPSSDYWPTSQERVRLPRVGETWEMRVELVAADAVEVRYRSAVQIGAQKGTQRLLNRSIFDAQFSPVEGIWVRHVRVLGVSNRAVTYCNEDGSDSIMTPSAFLANFVRSGA